MRTIAGALLLSLALVATGCSWYRSFTYGSPEGKTCLGKCEEARWDCRARCGASTNCLQDCEDEAKACRKTCPAVSAEEPEGTH